MHSCKRSVLLVPTGQLDAAVTRPAAPVQPPRCSHISAATPGQPGQRSNKRLQQLAELDMQDGWSVQSATTIQVDGAEEGWAVSAAPTSNAKPGRPRVGRKANQEASSTITNPDLLSKAGRAEKAVKARTTQPRAPYMDIQSEQGVLGLALLSARLKQAEGTGMSEADMTAVRDRLTVVQTAKSGKSGKLGSKVSIAASAAAAVASLGTGTGASPQADIPRSQRKKRVVYVDDDDNIIGEEDEAEDITDNPAFSLTLGDESMEFEEFDRAGNVVRRTSTPITDDSEGVQEGEDDSVFDALLEDAEDDDELDFSNSSSSAGAGGWQRLGQVQRLRKLEAQAAKDLQDAEEEELDPATQAPLSAREVEALLGGEGASGAASLLGGREQAEEEEEWGLGELKDSQQETLLEHLGVVKSRFPKAKKTPPPAPSTGRAGWMGGTLEGDGADIQWGGTGLEGLPPGADLGAQERLLMRMFSPHKAKQLLDHQRAAYEAVVDLRRAGSVRGKYGAEAKLHRQLRLVGGTAANKTLLSSQGSQTRPMMEKVRAAIFNMILSQAGTTNDLPPGSRWLDLFAGTGSVGLEALSRGAATAHFVEFDPWVCRKILGTNIASCGFDKQSIVHTGKAEQFLQRARDFPSFAGGAFDFISVCPPYLLVSYPELFQLLEGSPLLHERTILFVEYPKQLSDQVPEKLNNLEKVRDRKYGRTWIAVYAPPWAGQLIRGVDDVDEDYE